MRMINRLDRRDDRQLPIYGAADSTQKQKPKGGDGEGADAKGGDGTKKMAKKELNKFLPGGITSGRIPVSTTLRPLISIAL